MNHNLWFVNQSSMVVENAGLGNSLAAQELGIEHNHSFSESNRKRCTNHEVNSVAIRGVDFNVFQHNKKRVLNEQANPMDLAVVMHVKELVGEGISNRGKSVQIGAIGSKDTFIERVQQADLNELDIKEKYGPFSDHSP